MCRLLLKNFLQFLLMFIIGKKSIRILLNELHDHSHIAQKSLVCTRFVPGILVLDGLVSKLFNAITGIYCMFDNFQYIIRDKKVSNLKSNTKNRQTACSKFNFLNRYEILMRYFIALWILIVDLFLRERVIIKNV